MSTNLTDLQNDRDIEEEDFKLYLVYYEEYLKVFNILLNIVAKGRYLSIKNLRLLEKFYKENFEKSEAYTV